MSNALDEIQIQIRRDTAANWFIKNPILEPGEPCWDSTNNRLKIGTGARWNSTPHADGAYLFLDSQYAGERFRFYLPAAGILYRLDHSAGWRIAHNHGTQLAVSALRGGQTLQAGLYELENASTGPALLTLVVTPQQVQASGVFQLQELGAFAADRPNLYEKKLALVVGQANGFQSGQLLSHDGAAWVLATGERPVLGVCEFAQPDSFRVVISGVVSLPDLALTPGARYYRQPDGTLGTAENGTPLFTAIGARQGIFAVGGGNAGGGGASISVWSARAVKKDEVVVTAAGAWFKARQDFNSQTEPTVSNAFWEKLPDNFSEARVRATPLTGYAAATVAADLAAADTVLSAFGKLQKRITDLLGKAGRTENNDFTGVNTFSNAGGLLVNFLRNIASVNNARIDLADTGVDVNTNNTNNTPLTITQKVANSTAHLLRLVKGTTLMAWIDHLGWFNGAGIRVNGREDWIRVANWNPADLIGASEFPETEKVKMRDPLNWNEDNEYIGTPITNTYNVQQWYSKTTKKYYVCVEDNKWIRR